MPEPAPAPEPAPEPDDKDHFDNGVGNGSDNGTPGHSTSNDENISGTGDPEHQGGKDHKSESHDDKGGKDHKSESHDDKDHFDNGVGNGSDNGTPGHSTSNDENVSGTGDPEHQGGKDHNSESHDDKGGHHAEASVVETPVLSSSAHVHTVTDPGATVGAAIGADSAHTTTQTVTTGGNGTDFGNDSGTLVIHATADKGGDKSGFDILYDGQVIGHAGAGTTTLSGLDVHDGGKLSFQGAKGTNVTVDQITLNGENIDAGQGAKSGGVQVDSSHHNFDLHNGSVSFTVNDANAGAVTTTSETTHTQSLHVDVTGEESQLGGIHVTGLHAGDTVSDSGHLWVAGSDGSVTISEAQLDGMVSEGSIHHDFTVTSSHGAVDTVGVSGLDHDGGAYEVPSHLVADLNIAATDQDASASLTYNIDGVPAGCSLISDSGTHEAGTDGSFSLSSDDMHNLQLVMPADGSVSDFDLTVSATAQDGTSVASASQSLHVGVSEALDGGDADSIGVSGAEDHGIISASGHDVMGGGNDGDTFLFDFGGGHDTVGGGQGGNWTDVADAADNDHGSAAHASGDSQNWTDVSEHHGAAQPESGHDKGHDAPVQHHGGGEEAHAQFESIDHGKM
ncbi:MAG: hypothetical protein Q7R40_00355 [Phaeospirillum sp.]|nr:hypothetical protein [Phaeospirillum sp.]